MPILVVGYAKAGAGYDNREPRLWMQTLQGAKRRAYAAHINCFEAVPVFIACLFVAVWTDGSPWIVDLLASLFVLFRLGYVMAYITDMPSTRSILWSLAYLCALGIFLSGLMPWL
jgi:uncharacterized MAPEG superfamily protein